MSASNPREDFNSWTTYFDWLHMSTMEQVKEERGASIVRQVSYQIKRTVEQQLKNPLDKDSVY